MKNAMLAPQARVWTVRADVPISECVRLLRDHSVGALVVLSDDNKEDIVGVFTERDLVKNIELIQRGGFWESPVRTVMTAKVVTITPAQLADAPRLMARHQIRHLPVVVEEKGRKRLAGVLSMRDIFAFVMERLDFDLAKVYRLGEEKKAQKKVMAVFSSDPAISQLIDKGAGLTPHILVRSPPIQTDLENLPDVLKRFDALFIDLDDLKPVQIAKVLATARAQGREELLFLAFSPAKLESRALEELRRVSSRKRVRLLSKPIALGLLYEQFLREI